MPKVVDPRERRARLAAVTAQQIARDGFDSVTMRKVAKAAGVTTGAVSHYFTDKRELLLATFRSRADAARGRIEERVAAGTSQLDAIIEAALPIDDDGVVNWRIWLAFWGAAIGDPELTAAQRERQVAFVATVESALAAEVAAGRLGPVELGLEARRLVALLDGVAAQAIFDPTSWPPAAQRRVVTDHLAPLLTTNALGAAGSPASR